MARCRSIGGSSAGGSTRASAVSARALSAARAAGGAVTRGTGSQRASRRIGLERFGGVGGVRIEQQLDAELRLLERALAIAVERHAALEGTQRLVEALVALFHAGDETLELVEGFLEVGDLARIAGRGR